MSSTRDPKEPTAEELKEQKFYGFEEDVSGIVVPEALPLLPLRGVVIFPSAIVPLLISRGSSLKLVEDCLAGERMLGLIAQRNPEEEAPDPSGLHARGTAGRILKMLKYPDGSIRILVQGLRRLEVAEVTQREPYFQARVRLLQDQYQPSKDLEAVQANMVNQFAKFVSMIPYLPDELQVVVMNIKDPGKVTDLVASNLNISLDEKQDLLNSTDVRSRLERLSTILNREIELLELGHKIQSQVQTELNKNQKEFYLRQQMKAIQKELGEGDQRSTELEELRKKIEDAGMQEEARKAADNEMERLKIIPPESAEHTVVRTYLEWLVNLPWSKSTEDNLEIPHARGVLDEDHYDLEKIKDRILEYLAVRQLKKDPKGPILCFVGPPGTGKTSLGRSIARAIGRKFQRISLGGVRDEAEIRGHRRTYVGALPGRIIQAIRNAQSNNPLFMLDEIDKLGMDFRGDPASALLEVLDPEQNFTFVDHYLDVPFDLSKVMFITTANYLEPVPPALRDRMEVIELAGYTEEEKLEIARRHLIPKQSNRERPRRRQHRVPRRRRPRDHPQLHARSGPQEPRARDRSGMPQGGSRRDRGEDRARGGRCGARPRVPRTGALLLRGGGARARTGRGHRPRLDAERRRDPLHRSLAHDRQEGLDAHRPPRRGHEGVGAGRTVLHPLARREDRSGRRLLREQRPPRARPGGRDPEGRALRGRGDGSGAGFPAHRPHRPT